MGYFAAVCADLSFNSFGHKLQCDLVTSSN